MENREPLIRDFMTLQPQSVESKENIQVAADMMAKYGIRHLPVTTDGYVSGMLSEREVNLAVGIESIDPKQILVIDMCSERPYIVPPDTPLREVAGDMAKKHIGSAIVMENAHLIGIFTASDVCRALHDLLSEAVQGSNIDHFRKLRLIFGAGKK